MKSLWQKIQQLEALVNTKDVDAETGSFLNRVAIKCQLKKGDTTWLSTKQVEWLERIWERHFA